MTYHEATQITPTTLEQALEQKFWIQAGRHGLGAGLPETWEAVVRVARERQGLAFSAILKQSLQRSQRWHPGGLDDWSTLEWAGAMAGEAGEVQEAVQLLLLATHVAKRAGEACNTAKKLKRVEDQIVNQNAGERSITDVKVARKNIAKECADTILYAVLLAQKVDSDFESTLADVFNQKSIECGFPERLPGI